MSAYSLLNTACVEVLDVQKKREEARGGKGGNRSFCIPCVLIIVLHAATILVSRPVASTARRRSNGAVIVLLAAPLMKPAVMTMPGENFLFCVMIVGGVCGPPALDFNGIVGRGSIQQLAHHLSLSLVRALSLALAVNCHKMSVISITKLVQKFLKSSSRHPS